MSTLRLFRSKKRRAPPAVPAGTRVYAVGDIHGSSVQLETLLDEIVGDLEAAPSARNLVVFIGDYFDRGLCSRDVIDRLATDPLPQCQTVFLKGNHESMALGFLADPDAGPSWLNAGGLATLLSYGVTFPDPQNPQPYLAEIQARFYEALPSTHRDFFQRLRLWHREGDYLFVHAGINPFRSLDNQTEDDLLWGHPDFLLSTADYGVVVVHGHSVRDSPEVRPNRIGIDTGAYATGRLTCLVLEGTEHRWLQTGL